MGERVVDLGQISMKCCIPVVPREGVVLSFHCTLSQFRWLILCCQSAACSCVPSLLPNSQLSCKIGWTELFQWFWAAEADLQAKGVGDCCFLPRHGLSLHWFSVAYTPDLKGLELAFGFTEAGTATSRSLVFLWCLWSAVLLWNSFDLWFSQKKPPLITQQTIKTFCLWRWGIMVCI